MSVLDLLPVGDGGVSSWTPVPPGTPPYLRVQDLGGFDDLATYLQSSVLNAEHRVRTQQAPDVPQVLVVGWVAVKARVQRRATGGTHSFRPRLESAGVVVSGPTINLGGGQLDWQDYDYQTPGWRWEADPATGGPWTWEAALAAEVGLQDVTAASPHLLRWTLARKQIMVAHTRSHVVGRGLRRF